MQGFSQLHWMMKVSGDPNIAGRNGKPPRRLIPMSEVAQHNTEDDAWTVFRGRVFNITPYLHYHPGGVDILMEGAGRDCTELFDKYHSWVNAEGMIGALFLGNVDPASVANAAPSSAAPGGSSVRSIVRNTSKEVIAKLLGGSRSSTPPPASVPSSSSSSSPTTFDKNMPSLEPRFF